MPTLQLDAGEQTEALVQFLTHEMDDATLDTVDVVRTLGKTEGLASEPVTLAVTLTMGPIVAVAVLRIIERWLENVRQLATLKIVADGFSVSTEAGAVLARVATAHSQVAIRYDIAKMPKDSAKGTKKP